MGLNYFFFFNECEFDNHIDSLYLFIQKFNFNNHHIIIDFYADSTIDLCESIIHYVSLISFFIFTSSLIALSPYILTQFPIWQLREIILFYIKHPLPIFVYFIIVQFFNFVLLPIIQFSPITTLGPISQSLPILADESIKQFPYVFYVYIL